MPLFLAWQLFVSRTGHDDAPLAPLLVARWEGSMMDAVSSAGRFAASHAGAGETLAGVGWPDTELKLRPPFCEFQGRAAQDRNRSVPCRGMVRWRLQ